MRRDRLRTVSLAKHRHHIAAESIKRPGAFKSGDHHSSTRVQRAATPVAEAHSHVTQQRPHPGPRRNPLLLPCPRHRRPVKCHLPAHLRDHRRDRLDRLRRVGAKAGARAAFGAVLLTAAALKSPAARCTRRVCAAEPQKYNGMMSRLRYSIPIHTHRQ